MSFGLSMAENKVKVDVLVPSNHGSVKMKGYIGGKMDLCIKNRVMVQDVDRLVQPFISNSDGKSGFRGEFWGKWFTSAMLGYGYEPNLHYKAKVDEAINKLMDTQTPDGCISTYPPEYHLGTWDIWGRKYVLLGLISYYDQTGNKSVLDAAKKVADQLIKEAGPKSNINLAETGWVGWKGLAPSSVLEPVSLLYQRTEEKRYLEFCNHIISLWEKPNKLTPTGIKLIENAITKVDLWEMGGAPKAYEMMSCFEGLCEMYRNTGNKIYLDACKSLVESIIEDELMVVGSASSYEIWFNGKMRQTEPLFQGMETCVTVTWIKLLYQMLRLTGDSKYADEIEKSIYNALISSMTPDGTWWAYYNSLQGERCYSHLQYEDVALSCCVANGPRALLLVPQFYVMTDENGPVINIYEEGEANIKINSGNEVELIQKTKYPVDGNINITVNPKKQETFAVSLRIPSWSKNNSIKINGKKLDQSLIPGTYFKIDRHWSKNDLIELDLDMQAYVVNAPSGVKDLAIVKGPIVLSFDSRLVPEQLSGFSPPLYRYSFDTEADGKINVQLKDLNENNIWLTFDVPIIDESGAKHSISLCDFASAGNTYLSGNIFRVWVQQPFDLRHLYTKNLDWKANATVKEKPVIPEFYRLK
jgi:uncharacterized protein